MRLNLNCRDADIQQISSSEYRITFDLSKMIKPRLSENARMYIEHLNLPEFVDEAFGANNGEMRGYFELRCDNIDSNDFDTEFGNSGNNILYTSPLSNFKTFTNNDPMYISNFKISQNFLQNKLVMSLKVYDQFGTPYTTSKTVASVVDETTSEFAAYKTAIEALHVLGIEKDRVTVLANTYKSYIDPSDSSERLARIQFQEAKQDLTEAMEKYLKRKPGADLSVRNRIKTESLKDIIDLFDYSAYIYLFEEILPTRIANEPYSVYAPQLKDFYDKFVDLTLNQFQNEHVHIISDNILTSKNVRFNSTPKMDPANVNVKPVITPKEFDYKVVDIGGIDPDKTGTVKLAYFNSASNSSGYIIVDDITPDSGTTNELALADELIIDTNIESIIPTEYDYFFTKTTVDKTPGVTINPLRAQARFAFIVNRKNTTYTLTMREDLRASEFFEAGDTILISGSELGGESANDLTITINTAYVPPPTENYALNFTPKDFKDNGPLSIEIQRNNTSLDYSTVSSDFTDTSNFKVGDDIIISGNQLGGNDGTHNAIIKVQSVYEDLKYSVNQSVIDHSIPYIEINDTNSTVFDSTDSPNLLATNYKILVTSSSGDYNIIFNDATSTSTGFGVDDYILIQGSTLTGIDGDNDLKIVITAVDGSGKIEAAIVDSIGTYTARKPINPFGFDIVVKLNDDTYTIENIVGDEFVAGDNLTVEGTEMGGVTTVHDVTVEILTIKPLVDLTGVSLQGPVNTINIVGLTNYETAHYGQIENVLTPIGKAKYDIPGKILGFTIDPASVAVSSASATVPVIKVTINEESFQGLSAINSAISTQYTAIATKKKALVNVNTTYITELGPYQKQKMNCMNIRLVLYDEVPEYTQSSKDAIVGNTYSRLTGCQFKRI